MAFSEDILRILACPACLGKVCEVEGFLICPACNLKFPVQDGVPVMLLDAAQDA